MTYIKYRIYIEEKMDFQQITKYYPQAPKITLDFHVILLLNNCRNFKRKSCKNIS